jgi:hypothetical protein
MPTLHCWRLSALRGHFYFPTETRYLIKHLKIMKKIILFIFALATLSAAHAQTSWQWGSIGGSEYSFYFSNHIDERMRSMATDPNGNVYGLVSGANTIHIGNKTTSATNNHYALISWACDGHVRWVKTIGPSFPREIATDALGGVYLTGFMPVNSGNYFDTDTVIAPQGNNVLNGNYIIKYDTSGQLQWLTMPDPNIVTLNTLNNKPRFLHMHAAPNGDLFLLTYLTVGNHQNGSYPVTNDGFHILKYDKNGVFQNGVKLPITVPLDINGSPSDNTIDVAKFARDDKNGRFYIAGSLFAPAGYTEFILGNDTLKGRTGVRIFAMSFDGSGNLKWIKKHEGSNSGALGGIALDRKGQLYIAGQTSNGSQWNGSTFTAPVSAIAFALCMDSTGVNKWISGGYSPDNTTSMSFCIAVNNKDEIRVGGFATDRFTWGNFKLNLPRPAGSLIGSGGAHFASLDPQTGKCIGLDSLRNKHGYGTLVIDMSFDQNGNFYIGGQLSNSKSIVDTLLYVGADKLVAIGGDTDFFLAKYGTASCDAPINPNSIGSLNNVDGLEVYPNPTSSAIHIKGSHGPLQYSIFNTIGVKMNTGALADNQSPINVEEYQPGLYYLLLTDKAGVQRVVKVVKQ